MRYRLYATRVDDNLREGARNSNGRTSKIGESIPAVIPATNSQDPVHCRHSDRRERSVRTNHIKDIVAHAKRGRPRMDRSGGYSIEGNHRCDCDNEQVEPDYTACPSAEKCK